MNQNMAIKIYETTLLVTRIAVLNFLWFLLVLMGAGVFGLIPATVAIVSVYRRAYCDKGEFKWIKTAFKEYFYYLKKCFFLSLVLGMVTLSLILSYLTLGQNHIVFNRLILALLVYLYILVLPNLSVNLVHFELPLWTQVKNSMMLPFFWGLTSLKLLLALLGVAVLNYLIPGVLPFFSIGVFLYIATNQLLLRWKKQLTGLGLEGGELDA